MKRYSAKGTRKGGGSVAGSPQINAIALHMQAAFGDAAKRGRIDDMLLRKHAGGERGRRIGIAHRDRRLGDDRAFVHRGHHEMHGAAVDFYAVRQVRVHASSGRDRQAVSAG